MPHTVPSLPGNSLFLEGNLDPSDRVPPTQGSFNYFVFVFLLLSSAMLCVFRKVGKRTGRRNEDVGRWVKEVEGRGKGGWRGESVGRGKRKERRGEKLGRRGEGRREKGRVEKRRRGEEVGRKERRRGRREGSREGAGGPRRGHQEEGRECAQSQPVLPEFLWGRAALAFSVLCLLLRGPPGAHLEPGNKTQGVVRLGVAEIREAGSGWVLHPIQRSYPLPLATS